CDEPEECARRSLDWLAEYGGLRRGAYLAVDGEHNRLSFLAGYRVDAGRGGHPLELDDRTNALVGALLGGRPLAIDDSRAEHVSSPLGRTRSEEHTSELQ